LLLERRRHMDAKLPEWLQLAREVGEVSTRLTFLDLALDVIEEIWKTVVEDEDFTSAGTRMAIGNIILKPDKDVEAAAQADEYFDMLDRDRARK
jgi:hypothetical protein